MILLIDNYDSFSYNLVQMAGSINPDIKVIRNDAMTVEEIRALAPSHIILSPGPGYPKDAGVCEEVVRHLQGEIPILGVCLGHQGICEVYGCTISHAKQLMHGKKSRIHIDNKDAALEAAPPQPTSRLAAIPAARIADTCFFIVVLLLLPFGICKGSLRLRPL